MHGGQLQRVDFDESLIRTEREADMILDVDRAIEKLAAKAPRLCLVVQFIYFGGFTVDETGMALGVSTKTVQRDWYKASTTPKEESGGAWRPTSARGLRSVGAQVAFVNQRGRAQRTGILARTAAARPQWSANSCRDAERVRPETPGRPAARCGSDLWYRVPARSVGKL